MSAAPKYPSDLGYAGLRMTAEEFFGLGETRERYELIDGVVVMSPSPIPLHQVIIRLLMRGLDAWNRSAEYFHDTDVRLSPQIVYCPDLSVYLPGKLQRIPRRLETPPDLIVEVLSPSNKATDLITKRADYERFGVGEYWVIDPADGSIRAWKREGSRFVDHAVSGMTLRSAALAGFSVDLMEVQALCQRAE